MVFDNKKCIVCATSIEKIRQEHKPFTYCNKCWEETQKRSIEMKKSKTPKIIVNIYESELGYGKRLDSTHEFKTREEAEKFCKKYNAQNNKKRVPDWYMYAEIKPQY